MTSTRSVILEDLLGSVVDYAGLFPPAGLDMAAAVASYARYRASEQAWMLGSFVVPAARLPEFLAAAGDQPGDPEGWSLSLLVGGDVAATLRAATAELAGSPHRIAAVECRSADLEAALAASPADIPCFFELAPGSGLEAALETVRAHGRCAKLRTGSVHAEEIPPAAAVAAFIDACASMDVPFKATAGLHHPLRGEHHLHYGPDAPYARMHGFLNVFLGGALRCAGEVDRDGLAEFLEQETPSAFQLGGETIVAAGHALSREEIRRGRRFVRSFGSCSFEEPIDDLKSLQWL